MFALLGYSFAIYFFLHSQMFLASHYATIEDLPIFATSNIASCMNDLHQRRNIGDNIQRSLGVLITWCDSEELEEFPETSILFLFIINHFV